MSKALEDVKVLDLTQWEDGPQATMMMAFLGANVIKVELPGAGDPARYFSAVPLKKGQDSFYYMYYNHNKKSITLDLNKAKGREIFKEMIRQIDVLVENLEPGTMEKWGLNYDVLKEINPGLIYGRLSAYGSYGPYANYPGTDATVQAMAGLYTWTGYSDKPPVKSGPSVAETANGVNLFAAIMMALHEKDRTGQGQFVETTMIDSVLNLARVGMSSWAETNQLFTGPPRKRSGWGGTGRAPANLYPTKDEGAYLIFMFGASQDQWEILLKTIGHPELIGDPRFADQNVRGKNEAFVDKIISDWTSTKGGQEAFMTLASAGVSTGITFTSSQAMNDPHVTQRKMVVELEHPKKGKYKALGYPVKMEKSSVEVENAPSLGQDNEKVYADLLGYTKEDLAKLKKVGVI